MNTEQQDILEDELSEDELSAILNDPETKKFIEEFGKPTEETKKLISLGICDEDGFIIDSEAHLIYLLHKDSDEPSLIAEAKNFYSWWFEPAKATTMNRLFWAEHFFLRRGKLSKNKLLHRNHKK